jgi:predicted GIY-YIG superfamily endonuclease
MTNEVYRHYDRDGHLLYVGISLSAIERLREHRRGSRWFREIARIEIERHATRALAIAAEANAIRNERPLYNIQRLAVREGTEAVTLGEAARRLGMSIAEAYEALSLNGGILRFGKTMRVRVAAIERIRREAA